MEKFVKELLYVSDHDNGILWLNFVQFAYNES